MINIDDFHPAEATQLSPILDFDDLEVLRDQLTVYWANNHTAFRR